MADKRLFIIMLAIAVPILAWAALAFYFGLPDSDPRSPRHYIAVFFGGLFGLLATEKTNNWRLRWGGTLLGALIGLAYVLTGRI